MSVRQTPVAVVVLAARGGVRLARALEAVAWANERIVLDAAARLADASLPPGVRRVTTPDAALALATAPWLLLVSEDEVVSPALATAVAATVAAPAHGGYRIGREVSGFGAVLRAAGAPVRLARRGESGIVLGAGLVPALRVPGARVGRLAPRLRAEVAAPLAIAVEDMEADAAALAGVLRAGERAPFGRAAVVSVAAAGTRLLLGRVRRVGPDSARWARWFLAVLAGYRAMIAYAKLWEQVRGEAAALR